MNPDVWPPIVGLGAGLASGTLYFLGLWATVVRLPTASRPRLLLFGSLLLRLGGALATFYALVPLGWTAMAAALAGFLVSRQVLLVSRGRPGRQRH